MWDLGGFDKFCGKYGRYNVLVVGGGDGIVKAVGELLAGFGAAVVNADRNIQKATTVAGMIAIAGGKATALKTDITDVLTTARIGDDAVALLDGPVHAVVNTAGITGLTNSASDLTDLADFERVYHVNLRGGLALTNAVLPAMLHQGYGRILHVSSIAGKEGNRGMASYSASKAGLIGLVKSLAKDTAGTGVTINSLAPAVIRTSLVDALPDETVDYMTAKIPMARCGTLDEAARMATFIVSPACSFTTGFTFDLSGGRATY